MIKDTIIYRNQTILTVYHNGFDEEYDGRIIRREERIGKYKICFIEEKVDDESCDNIKGWIWKEEALLPVKTKYSPYYEKACAYMIHFVYIDKPSVLFREGDGIYDNRINIEEFSQIIKFIEKFIGMNLTEKPVYLGDVFVFSSSKFGYHINKENEVIIDKIKKGMKVIVHFKKEEQIVESKIIEAKEEDELVINAECDWNNHDIEVYQNNKLIYIDRNISYIRSIHISYSIKERAKRVPLSKLKKYYEIGQNESIYENIIGEETSYTKNILSNTNQSLVKKMKNIYDTEQFMFIKPNEIDIAMDKIGDILISARDEVWIFDSYFTDLSGITLIMDWIRIIVNICAKEKNIVFYCKDKDKALSAKDFSEYISKDKVVSEKFMNSKKLDIKLIQTRAPIHDRFIITRNNDMYSGILIGTSFNSLNSNHYCISKLSHSEAVTVINDLKEWMRYNVVERIEI